LRWCTLCGELGGTPGHCSVYLYLKDTVLPKGEKQLVLCRWMSPNPLIIIIQTQKILRISNHSSQHPSHSKIWMHSQSHTGSKQQNPNSTHLLSSPWAAVSREVTTRRMKVMEQKQRRCHQQLVTSKSKDQWGRWEELRRRDFRNLTRF
jgi:hypothetical protein